MVPFPPSTSIPWRATSVAETEVTYLLAFTSSRYAPVATSSPVPSSSLASSAVRAMVEASAPCSSTFIRASCSRTAGNKATGAPNARRWRAKEEASR